MVARQFWVVARCLIAYQKSPMSQVTIWLASSFNCFCTCNES